jgi:hypothetical protein
MTRIVLLLLALVSLAAQAGPAFNNVTAGDTITVNQNGYAVQYPVQTLMGASGATVTQGILDNSTASATDAFVNQQARAAVATIPATGITGGIYNQATLGSGAVIVVFASAGTITSSLTISNPGSGYAVGDLLVVAGGNNDAILRVTAVSGGGITAVGIPYGGTGYVTGLVNAVMGIPPGRRAVTLSGTLTSNVTWIISAGTYLNASREVEVANNTTGAFTVTVFLSNGAGGTTGTGVVLPQGTNNSTTISLYTDGVNDVWPTVNAFPAGVTCSGSPTASFATKLGVVTHC